MQNLHRIGWSSLAALLPLSIIMMTTAIAKPFTYVNERFGQSCTFPDEIFSDRMPEPENGDGQQWLSADGAELTCSGINNVDDETPRSFVDEEKASTEPGYKVTYSKTGKNWAVLSGTKDGKIFYERRLFGKDDVIRYERRLFGKDDVIRTVFVEYPPSLKAKYDPLVGAITKSLREP